nr:hypothetical protein [Tanacetum cinerariifolium]
MATTIEQQTALDESFVPSTKRLRIRRRNFRLPSDIQSKESTLQVIYEVLRNSPLFRAFQVTADVPEIYMQEFWATAKLHHNSIRFKIDTRKSVLDLEAFREMLHISPRIPNQSFANLPTEEEILEFLRINWHYVRDDALFSTIKVVSRHQTTQQYGAILPIELTTAEIRNSKAYKEYHACAMGEATPKPKASARKKKDVQRTEAEQLKIVLKRSRQETHISQQSGSGTVEGTGSKPGVPNIPSDDSEEELSWKSSDGEDVEEDENFDSIPRTPEESEEESNDEEEHDLRFSEEARIQEEEDADEFDVEVESIFTTTSSSIVSLETPTLIMTPSTIATITTSGEAPTPQPTIPSIILENLPTFNSAFRFEERLRSLETSFFEYRQTNQFADAVSAIPKIVHQYMDQQMKEAVREAVQI